MIAGEESLGHGGVALELDGGLERLLRVLRQRSIRRLGRTLPLTPQQRSWHAVEAVEV